MITLPIIIFAYRKGEAVNDLFNRYHVTYYNNFAILYIDQKCLKCVSGFSEIFSRFMAINLHYSLKTSIF